MGWCWEWSICQTPLLFAITMITFRVGPFFVFWICNQHYMWKYGSFKLDCKHGFNIVTNNLLTWRNNFKRKYFQLVMMVGQSTIVGLCMKNEDLEPCPYLYLDIHGCIQESMWAYQDWVFGVIEPHPPNKLIIHLGLNCDDKCYIIWCVGWRVYVVGSKWHITSQCVYFAFRIIVHFGVFFFPKTCFPQEEFSNEMFWNFLYILFIITLIFHFFLPIKFGEIWIFESA